MTLNEFLDLHGSKMGFLETAFLKHIYYEDYGDAGLDLITSEVEIDRNDGSNKKWRIDFVIKTSSNSYAVECDGYNYHAPGMVSKERFNELERKRNETLRQGYQLISLSKDQIIDNPSECIFEIRRTVNSDSELFNLFLNRSEEFIKPHLAQQSALNALKIARDSGKDKGLVVLATGLGKTYLSAFDVKKLNAKSMLFIVHIDFILKQAKNSFEKVMPEKSDLMGFYTGKQKDISGKKFIFTTIQTINKEKNLANFTKDFFDYIIIDESHHTAAESYRKIVNYFQPKFLLGLTATPERMDKKDILEFFDDNLIFEMDQVEAIRQGYLVKLNYKGYLDNVDYTDIYYNGFKYDVNDLNKFLMIEKRDQAVIEKFKELAINKKTIGFCASIEHADWTAEKFRKAGFDAVSIHSKINNDNTDGTYQYAADVISAFDKNTHQIAFVVDMLNEGIDIPDVECLLMLRPTESNTILTQQIGRGLRIFNNKKEILVLDFIGNYRTAPKILIGLGLGNNFPEGFSHNKDKDIYFYENEGRTVEFQAEVVDIFKYMLSRTTNEVRQGAITEQWEDYGNYLELISGTGSSLYWSVSKKNNDLKIHLWALNFLKENQNNYLSNNELSNALKKESIVNFPNNTLEGIRALFFSKLIGLIESTNPLIFSEAYEYISDQKKIITINNLLSSQVEKFYFFNEISSLNNRHGEKRTVDKLFHIYPIFFIYQLFIILIERGYHPTLSKFEIDNFVVLCRNHGDIFDCVDKIITFREYSEKYELEKFIAKKSSKMDTRFFKILVNLPCIIFSPKNITLDINSYDVITEKVLKFNKLLASNSLITYSPSNRDEYRKMLYSKLDLISYHDRIIS
jgi:superfamily II DNA or RNA helicase